MLLRGAPGAPLQATACGRGGSQEKQPVVRLTEAGYEGLAVGSCSHRASWVQNRPSTRAARTRRTSAALRERQHAACGGAGEELTRPADLVLRVGDQLVELCDPADRAGEREDGGEQAHRNADGALHDA